MHTIGQLQNRFDSSVIIQCDKYQLGAFIIRAQRGKSLYQVVLIVVEKKWRKGSSFTVAALKLTFSPENAPSKTSGILTTCSCHEFCSTGDCKHKLNLLNETDSRRRLLPFIHSEVRETNSMSDGKEWQGVMLTKSFGDYCSVWQIFKREYLNMERGSSATVLFDERRSRAHLGCTLRVKCLNCGGDASKRLMCAHEIKCVAMVKERDRVAEARNEISAEDSSSGDE